MSKKEDERFRDAMVDRVIAYHDKFGNGSKPLTEEEWSLVSSKIQSFIDGLGLSVVMIVEPAGGYQPIQFNTKGMPHHRAFGYMQLAMQDHQAGMICSRVMHGIRMDREFGRTFLADKQGGEDNGGSTREPERH